MYKTKHQNLQPRQSDISLCHVRLTDDCLPVLMSVYFIANTKYSIAHLFPVLLTRRFQILKYTYYAVFRFVSLKSLSFIVE